jgi:hypothetical protein
MSCGFPKRQLMFTLSGDQNGSEKKSNVNGIRGIQSFGGKQILNDFQMPSLHTGTIHLNNGVTLEIR